MPESTRTEAADETRAVFCGVKQMTARVLTIGFVALASVAAAQEHVDTVSGLQLYSSFWLNLHHRLHADARDGKKRVDTAAMTAADREAWQAAIDFYALDLAKRDLRTGRDMSAINDALSAGLDQSALPISDDHRRVLEGAANVYRKQLWPQDDRVNRFWIADVSARLRIVAPRVLPQLAAFYRLPWYDDGHTARVDIVNVGGARGGYTWTRPRVHTVIDGADATYQGWTGVEMLLHEASHGLTDTLASEIDKELAAAGTKDDGVLWHVAQFFVVGEVLKRTLAADAIAFSPYMYSTGLFDRAWSRFRLPIETQLNAYLDGKQSLQAALKAIASGQ
jgi:hypothetical protein